MHIQTKSIFDQSQVDCHNEKQAKKFDEVIGLAGGVLSLSSALGVKPEEIQRWKRNGGVPIYHALHIEYAFDVQYIDLIRYDEALPLSEATFRQSLRQITSSIDQDLQKIKALKQRALRVAQAYDAIRTPSSGDDK